MRYACKIIIEAGYITSAAQRGVCWAWSVRVALRWCSVGHEYRYAIITNQRGQPTDQKTKPVIMSGYFGDLSAAQEEALRKVGISVSRQDYNVDP